MDILSLAGIEITKKGAGNVFASSRTSHSKYGKWMQLTIFDQTNYNAMCQT